LPGRSGAGPLADASSIPATRWYRPAGARRDSDISQRRRGSSVGHHQGRHRRARGNCCCATAR
jgi:hypothetical protein